MLAPKGYLGHDRGETVRGLIDQRGWIAHDTEDALAAMAELCLLDRTQTTRREWGLHAVEQLALVVVEPRHWPMLEALLAAARRFVPQVTLWSYDDQGLRQLPGGTESPAPKRPARKVRAEPVTPAAPCEIDPPQISREEISMLLDGNEQEPQG
jgi:hypothetical protein